MNALQRLTGAIEQRQERKQGSTYHAQQRATGKLWGAITKVWAYQQRYDEYERFTVDSAGYPGNWIQGSAAAAVSASEGFWTLQQSSNGTWAYHRQSAVHFENDTAANDSTLYRFGAIAWDDRAWQCDLSYRFSITADNAGAPDAANDLAIVIDYDHTGGTWRVRGERTMGSVVTSGSWIVLSSTPISMPLWFTVRVWNNASRDIEMTWSNSPIMSSGSSLWSSTFTPQIGQGHWYLSATRGTGDTRKSTLRLSGLDVRVNCGT